MEHDACQLFTFIKGAFLKYLQRGRNHYALQRTTLKDTSQILVVVVTPYFSQRLQTLVQLDTAKVHAKGERVSTDPSCAGGQVYLFDTAFRERGSVYLLKIFWKFHALQARARAERPRLDGLQRRRNSDAF